MSHYNSSNAPPSQGPWAGEGPNLGEKTEIHPGSAAEKAGVQYVDAEKGALEFDAGSEQGKLQQGIKRKLKPRHLAMISIGGTIGTGLFLGSGNNIAKGGPLGALLGYMAVGLMVYCMMMALGEMATYIPLSGSFNHYGGRFVDPALTFALGWNYWLSWAVTLASELSAAGIIIQFWTQNVHTAVWGLIFLAMLFSLNTFGVRAYGEAEYWFSLIKVLTCIVFIIVGIVVDAGGTGDYIGGRYWRDPYSPFVNGFRGFFDGFVVAGYAFQGTEIVGVAAGESQNPRRDVPRAIRNVFFRILLFYILSVLMIGLCIPADDPNLLESGDPDTASIAPFTLVFQKAGWAVAAHIVNAVILTAVLSAGNSSLYASSRTLCALAREGKAPRFFGKVTSWGAPILPLMFSSLIGCLCTLAAVFSSEQVFFWLLNLTSITGYISWAGILGTHIRFRMAMKAQGRSLDELPYRASLHPWADIYGLIICLMVIFGSGYKYFDPFDVKSFFATYIGLGLFAVFYLSYKLIKRTKVVPLRDVDLDSGRQPETEDDSEKALPWWRKMLVYIV
ncbi:uncharacterized protein VTP21DRAFT_9469 [Calcarisporiella thermophila]|uniref:uncharacterized protein n=1 Tax=Calcarisporiella thermophila TaxID=911321 RepID=UPI003743D738